MIWVAEQLDLIGHIDRACGDLGAAQGPSVGEWTIAVAIQRACAPGPKCGLAEFLEGSVPRLSCLPSASFTGQGFHRVAQQVTEVQLEQVQVAISKAAVARFELSTDVLAFDTTNFDTHIATPQAGVQLLWELRQALRRRTVHIPSSLSFQSRAKMLDPRGSTIRAPRSDYPFKTMMSARYPCLKYPVMIRRAASFESTD